MGIRLFAAAVAVAAASLAGCAQMHSTEMGAGPAKQTVCKDGTVLPPDSKCHIHGGVQSRQ